MDENLVCVKYMSALNEIAKKTFKRMHRVKFTCFTVSQKLIAFGASSGGVYIFQRECCKFLKFIPNKESSILLVTISKDEKHLGMATSKGNIIVTEKFLTEPDVQSKIYHEHAGTEIMCLLWQENDLYIGDSRGKVSVVTAGIDILPKTLFQLPLATLLNLESSIVQMDIYRQYLLVSTRTRTFICDTQKEVYKHIGKKPRDGFFGACFYGPKLLDAGYTRDSEPIGDKTRGTYRTFNENDVEELFDINNECVILCARPGIRLWQANFDGSVEVTYQFKNSMKQKSTNLLLIHPQREARLQIISHTDVSPVPDNNFNFGKIFAIGERFILSYTLSGLYVFDPQASELRFWIDFHCDIRQVEIKDSIIFVWTTDLEISLIALVHLEEIILRCLYKKQYLLCADMCLHFSDTILDLVKISNKLYLLSALKEKIAEEKLLKLLGPIFVAIEAANQKLNTNELEIEMDDTEWKPLSLDDLNQNLDVSQTRRVSVEDIVSQSQENKNIEIFTKQFKLHKTHKNINIPDFQSLLKCLSFEDLVSLTKEFIQHTMDQWAEDPTNWCQGLILQQILSRNTRLNVLNQECLEFVQDAFIAANQDLTQYICQCNYPLPNCHNFKPKYYNIGLALIEITDQRDLILQKIPYYFKTCQDKLRLSLTVQYCDKDLFISQATEFTYDKWDQTMRLFVKLSKGYCLNCDKKIDSKGILSWSEFSSIILRSLGAQNTLKLLKRYSSSIPNGALNHTFYQSCIFMATFNCGTTCQEPKLAVDFVNNLDELSLLKLQKSLTRHLDKKYLEKVTSAIGANSNDTGQNCSYCHLPLKNPILGSDRRFILECAHQFHSLCFSRINSQCNLCK